MSRSGRQCAAISSARAGFALVEVAISIVVVGVMLVAALHTVGATRTTEYKLAERNRAWLLAQQLLAEILQQAYADADFGPTSFGLGAAEVGSGTRLLFDDVDDYDGWQASPPQNKDGSLIPGASDYEQLVAVAWVNPSDLAQASASPTGVKRIAVTIRRQGRPIVTIHAYRTIMWSDLAVLQGGGS